MLVATSHVIAAGAPDIGDIPRAEPPRALPNIPPATIKKQAKPAYQRTDENNAIKVSVESFTFSGNQSITSEQLGALLSEYSHREIGIKALNEATKKITEFYRKKGYFLAQAYLPAQDIAKNTVEIAIIEGKLDQLMVNGGDGLNQHFVEKIAAYRLSQGNTVSDHNLVRNVTILNALPGLDATAQLNPSDIVGSTDIDIAVEPLPRLQAYLGANTFGNPFTGREVVLAGASWNNPLGQGDQLSLNLKRSRNNGQRGLDLGYITPVHASGTLLSLRYNYVDYKLGGALKALDAFGDSQYFDMTIDQPLVRDAQKGLSVRIGTSYKRVNDEVALAALENRRHILAGSVGLFGDWLNDDGSVSYQLGANLRSGKVIFQDDVAKAFDQTGPKTSGGFVKYNLNANRLQYFANGVSLALRADYQRAGKNLDSVEKISTGGINSWRQFAELPSLADSGFVVGTELRKKIPATETLAKLHMVDISPYGFIDYGRGKLNQKASVSDNHVKSTHVGIGVDTSFKHSWFFTIAASHQNRDYAGASGENEVRVWGQLLKYF